MRIIFFWLCCFSGALFANIATIEKFSQARLPKLDSNTLVVFDVDDTLTVCEDALLQVSNREFFKKHAHIDQSRKGEIFSILLGQATARVLDPKSVEYIRFLQKSGAKVIACTAAPFGKIGSIENFGQQRLEKLREFGFDFSKTAPVAGEVSFSSDGGQKMLCNQGIVFTSLEEKGPALKRFFSAIGWTPKRIVFFDDKRSFLESVEKMAEREKIEFWGYEYTYASQLQSEFDPQVALFQCQKLVEEGKWFSDAEAKQALFGVECYAR